MTAALFVTLEFVDTFVISSRHVPSLKPVSLVEIVISLVDDCMADKVTASALVGGVYDGVVLVVLSLPLLLTGIELLLITFSLFCRSIFF